MSQTLPPAITLPVITCPQAARDPDRLHVTIAHRQPVGALTGDARRRDHHVAGSTARDRDPFEGRAVAAEYHRDLAARVDHDPSRALPAQRDSRGDDDREVLVVVTACGYFDHVTRRGSREQSREKTLRSRIVAQTNRRPVRSQAHAVARAERVAIDGAGVDDQPRIGRTKRNGFARGCGHARHTLHGGETRLGRRRQIERVDDVARTRVPVRAAARDVETRRFVYRVRVRAHPLT